MIKRKKTKKIKLANVEIGGNSPVSVQSMCNTDTKNIDETVKQINELTKAGCEIIRVAVPDKKAAMAIKNIKEQISIPLVADIHFDYRLAIASIENSADGLRLNPGNIGKKENIEKVVKLAKERQIPVRIGVNAGSLEKDLSHKYEDLPDSLVKSALRHIRILEDLDFDLIKVSLKASDVNTMISAYRKISELIDYPLHLGVTEAGTMKAGLIKSSVGIGSLLHSGIGDTIRISLTENPIEEVYAGWELLKALNIRKRGINLISCPTCGRCQIDLIKLAKQVEEKFKDIAKPLTLAVMGCPVNGPGEAKSADIGIAGALDQGYIFRKGEIINKVPYKSLLLELEKEVENYLAQY